MIHQNSPNPANLVLQDTVERIFLDDVYGDIRRGVYIVRGENVEMLGEIDPEREIDDEDLESQGKLLFGRRKVPYAEVEKRFNELKQIERKSSKAKTQRFARAGMESYDGNFVG